MRWQRPRLRDGFQLEECFISAMIQQQPLAALDVVVDRQVQRRAARITRAQTPVPSAKRPRKGRNTQASAKKSRRRTSTA